MSRGGGIELWLGDAWSGVVRRGQAGALLQPDWRGVTGCKLVGVTAPFFNLEIFICVTVLQATIYCFASCHRVIIGVESETES